MFSNFHSLQNSSLSYAINCEIQSPLAIWIDRKTENTRWVRFPAACLFLVSNIVKTFTRTMAVLESFLYGSKRILKAPFSENKIECLKIGVTQISKETFENILRLSFVIVEIFFDCIFGVLTEPKLYIIESAGSAEVNLNHARKGTVGSLEYKKDSNDACDKTKERLLNYQRQLHHKEVLKKKPLNS